MTPYQTHLAERASKEMDSVKLLALVAELCRALDNSREYQCSPVPALSPATAACPDMFCH
jgi:hypothetical protein